MNYKENIFFVLLCLSLYDIYQNAYWNYSNYHSVLQCEGELNEGLS